MSTLKAILAFFGAFLVVVVAYAVVYVVVVVVRLGYTGTFTIKTLPSFFFFPVV